MWGNAIWYTLNYMQHVVQLPHQYHAARWWTNTAQGHMTVLASILLQTTIRWNYAWTDPGILRGKKSNSHRHVKEQEDRDATVSRYVWKRTSNLLITKMRKRGAPNLLDVQPQEHPWEVNAGVICQPSCTRTLLWPSRLPDMVPSGQLMWSRPAPKRLTQKYKGKTQIQSNEMNVEVCCCQHLQCSGLFGF